MGVEAPKLLLTKLDPKLIMFIDQNFTGLVLTKAWPATRADWGLGLSGNSGTIAGWA